MYIYANLQVILSMCFARCSLRKDYKSYFNDKYAYMFHFSRSFGLIAWLLCECMPDDILHSDNGRFVRVEVLRVG